MADFILNAPGTVNDPFSPANILNLVSTLKSDATGIRCETAGVVETFAHNASYNLTSITTTVTLATTGNNSDDIAIGAVVRTGANASNMIGVYIGLSGVLIGTFTTSTTNNISGTTSITRAANDVWSCTVAISGGVASVTCKQNGTTINFSSGNTTTTTYATESSLAAGAQFNPFNNNSLYISQFTGTGVSNSYNPLAPMRQGGMVVQVAM